MMRGWLFGGKAAEEKGDDTQQNASSQGAERQSSSGERGSGLLAAADAFSSLTRRGVMGSHDAEIERKVSLAARNLCYGVQRIVMAAKGKSGVEWKAELLTLLGGSDDQNPKDHCDMDVLLVAPKTEKFVMRCLENELPPNMIHCLRLLRVLELQHATQKHKEMELRGTDTKKVPIKPISSRATAKVSQLLCTLCTDQKVGEQLRPHLFGLLALSGASYPASGVHVAKAASEVIIAFAEHCLSEDLVWFLHDRKMIIHMTDDIKELCGSTAGDVNNANALSLYGVDAEEYGLWAISLSTVIHLVVNSCRHSCQELLNDFEDADGNQVLESAIVESKSKHGKKLMELLPLLATCRVSEDAENDLEINSMADPNNHKLAMNPAAFEIMEDLMYRSIPLLSEYVNEHDGEKPEITDDASIRALAEFSLKISTKVRFTDGNKSGEGNPSEPAFDIATDLLLACLNLFSEHTMNYELVEEHKSILSFYILSFPAFSDENLKVLILKTIEFVVTGVTGSNALRPFEVICEVFVVICKALLNGAADISPEVETQKFLVEGLFKDTVLINESLEKLFRFDARVGPAIIQSGDITRKVNEITTLLLKEIEDKKGTWLTSFDDNGKTFVEPPTNTPIDSVCSALFRVLALIMGEQSKRNLPLLSMETGGKELHHDINSLLVSAVKELGDDSAAAACGVFETIMSSRETLEYLRDDMQFCLNLVDHFTQITSQICGVSKVAQTFNSKKLGLRKTAYQDTEYERSRPLELVLIRRIQTLYSMIKNVLETSRLARDAFRLCGGFESIVYAVLSLGGSALHEEGEEEGDSEMTSSLIDLFQTMLGVIVSAIGFNSRETAEIPDHQESSKRLAITLRADTIVDPVSSQHSSPTAAAQNLFYLRFKRIYLDFAIAIAQTKVLERGDSAVRILELAMSHMDPSFSFARVDTDKNSKVQTVRNPDAARLVLGLVIFLPETEEGTKLSKRAFDQIIRLCDPSRLGSTLSQIAGCGMIWSITNPKEFAPVLNDTSHPLYTRFTLLLRRIAAFSMSYNDFVSVIRGLAGPLLTDEKSDYRIRLPVLSSSIRRVLKTEDVKSDAIREKENDYCRLLESLSTVAEKADRVPYCTLGGDTINTLSVLLHKTKVEDRLYKAAEEGRLNFMEIDCIDVSALKPGGFLSAGVAAPGSSGGERIWTPLASSGFSYSLWFRYPKTTDEKREGNIYLLDMSNQSVSTGDGAHTPQSAVFLSFWYDVQQQCFNILSSTSHRGEPTAFPTSPLSSGVWHHILLTYTPTKRTMMGRKSVCALYVDGRPLETEIKIESVNIAPNARVIVGAPNPAVAVSGVVRGMIPVWDLGPTLMLSTVLFQLDATAMFIHGPEFEGLFWGDRPQRLSLSATGSAAFALLAETGEPGSVASALRRREIARLEAAGTVSREMGLGGASDEDNDSLASLGLLCTIPPDCVVFAYRAASCNPVSSATQQTYSSRKRICSSRLINMARINSSYEFVASDAATYGKAGVVIPRCFADNVQWAGGPQILMPLAYAATTSRSLALSLRLIRASTMRHPPNLEAMQSGGGFQTLAIVMYEKKLVDETVLDQSFAFAVHGFSPAESDEIANMATNKLPMSPQVSDFWVFSDLDAMKQLLLNHQVWDMKTAGPDLPLRLISFMNGLVGQKSIHKAFNSRRLHLVGIVRWTLHLMIEAAELYTAGEVVKKSPAGNRLRSASSDSIDLDIEKSDTSKPSGSSSNRNLWYSEAPNADAVAVGGDPDNPLLNACKTLLRRVLTFMLTPGDLDAIAEAIMYTVNIGGFNPKTNSIDKQKLAQTQALQGDASDIRILLPGSVARVYLLRLVEELVVDGVNEIIASGSDRKEGDPSKPDMAVHQHSGGIANPNQTYLSMAILGGQPEEGVTNPKHPQAQSFLSAFASVFTPVWFAALLEGCHDEATASAVLRLMILMQQSSPTFAGSFEAKGGYAPLVLSIPKFSTCPSIIISLLSQLLHVSILHLPCFPILDAAQLNEVFESEGELSELMSNAYMQMSNGQESDPSCGVFSLLAECMGRNLQLAPFDNELAATARQTNKAILELLAHRHNLSPSFQAFCRTQDFIEPLAQTLCLVYDERLQKLESGENEISSAQDRNSRRGSLKEVPLNISAMERYVGTQEEVAGASGYAMVQLLRHVISNAISSGPGAPPLVYMLFTAFPIHASAEQVGAYQLVLLDLVKSIVEDAIDLGEAAALACSIGVISVLVDRMMKGFFTSEPTLQTVSLAITLLKDVASSESGSSHVGNAELSMLNVDAAHIARLACISALKRSRPMSSDDPGDPELQAAVVQIIAKNIHPLMIVPKASMSMRRVGNSLHPAPPANSKAYPLWLSASIQRCAPAGTEIIFPDLSECDEPLKIFVVALMVEVAVLLNDPRDRIREATISIVVALLQQRRGIMSGILIKDIQRSDKVETIDVMNRGGFGALLVAHEVAMSAGGSAGKKDYTAFFEWLERNQEMVQLVFDDIKAERNRVFPSLETGASTTSEAVEVEQQAMVMKLSSNDVSDITIIGGLQRAEIAQKGLDKTLLSHIHWKRQGFDDLASGAMQWKFLLRRLKGSRSLWEGGPRYGESQTMVARHQHLYTNFLSRDSLQPFTIKEDGEENPGRELVTRWKLDLTEGCERQRRRLLPNYEFYSLYNVDENDDNFSVSSDEEGGEDENETAKHKRRSTMIGGNFDGRESQNFLGDGMEATAELLKGLNLKAVKEDEDAEAEEDALGDDSETEATSVTTASSIDVESVSDPAAKDGDMQVAKEDASVESESHDQQEAENASSYELITGLLEAGDWPSQSYNVRRCTGLEVRKALLLWCPNALYVIDGFESAEGEGLDGRITRVEKEESSYNVNIRPKDFKVSDEEKLDDSSVNTGNNENEKNKSSKKATQESANAEVTYQHRSQRIAFTDLQSVFRRRYQLQHNALEFYDIHNSGTLIAFSSTAETEEILSKVLAAPLPNSIFSSSYGTSINYKKFMASWKSKTISQWMNGKMTNFEFLMHLNSFAGRTYNDLTQYPVFPWVIADYDSEEIDLDDPKTYRDLSKPMGALGDERAQQFRDRYEALEANYFNEDEPPPFHYGTHYSCAAYVLYYLMRLEPFSRLALTLQGGRFDVADRLFHNIGSSWKSASGENLQDVRELIPEFFYLPDFLTNTNHFDFGTTQKGKTVHNVTLPKWAKGDPQRFIRINRQALESDYVSTHLHLWIDLIFGYKQRGEEAVKSLNTFVHVTYEGAVDLDSMTDPVQRESTIAQIQNFGQTPSRLERKPFPQRFVFSSLKGDNIDFGALSYLAPLTPPFCVVGADHRSQVKRISSETCKLGVDDQYRAVGDMCLLKGAMVGVGRMCVLHIPSKTYIRFGSPNNGITVHVGSLTARNREPNKIISIHDSLHRAAISAAKVSLNGAWLVTGCIDSTVRVWKYDTQMLRLRATLCGHAGWKITCLDVSSTFGLIVTGCAQGRVLLWDLRTLTFVRRLDHQFKEESEPSDSLVRAASSVSINHINGNIVTLVGPHLSIFDVNGNLLGTENSPGARPSCAIATDCPEWQERGVVAVTGHVNGEVRFWSLDYDTGELSVRHLMVDVEHTCEITSLRVTGTDRRQDTLLIGDQSGKMSVCKTVQLENMSSKEVQDIVMEMKNGDIAGQT